jgi:integrase
LRLGDLICLRWGAVDFQAGFIRTMMAKTHKPIAVPMAAPVQAMLGELHKKAGKVKPTDFIWPKEAKAYQESGAGQFSNEFYSEVLVPCGLVPVREYWRDWKKGKGVGRAGKRKSPGVSFHCLRHSFISALKLSGGSQTIAKELAGHGSDAVNQLYTHTPEAALTAAVNALPALNE